MPQSRYETHDIHLASFLLCQGGKLVAYDRLGPRRHAFVFATDAKLHEMLRLYWSNVPVSFIPSALFSSLGRLRSLARMRAGSPQAKAVLNLESGDRGGSREVPEPLDDSENIASTQR